MLEVGEVFLDDLELARITQETQWEKMLHGVFHYNIKTGNNSKTVDPLVPLPATLSEINSDLLFGEFPEFKFPDDAQNEAMKEWLKDHDEFETDILEACTYTSAMGTLFNRHFKAESKRYDTFIKSNQVIWDEDVFGLIMVRIFKFVRSDKANTYFYYDIEDHFYESNNKTSPLLDEERKYVVETYKIKVRKNDQEVDRVWDIKKEITDLKDMPIVKVVNQKQLGQKTGKSDYQGKEQLFAGIDNRVDQINYVLDEHVEPWMGMPSGILNEKGQINRKLGKMFEKAPGNGDNDITIAAWDPQLEASFEQIRTQIRLVLFTSRIASPIAGFEVDSSGGQLESGRALKWRSVPTWSMINRKRKYWNMFFKQYFTKVNEMGDLDVDVENMLTLWKDGLPLDEEAVVESVMKQINMGIMSRRSGMQEIREIDEDTVKKEIAVIQEEKQANANIESSKFRVTV